MGYDIPILIMTKKQIIKLNTLCKLVEILINDRYANPGHGHINNIEINEMLKEIKESNNE